MKYGLLFTTLLISAVLIGAGCKPSDSPVSLDKYKVPGSSDQQAANPSPPMDALIPEADASAPPEANIEEAPSSTPPAEPAEALPPTEESSKPKQETTMPEPKAPETLAFPGVLPEAQLANKQVRIKTTKGDIVFEILPKEGPKAASNFVYLTERSFYNGLKFHRVEPGFVIQGGDPNGNGTGGPGYKFEDDTVNLPYKEGIVAMANAGPNTNGSQFFIMLGDNPLPPNYSIFGRVTSGMDVVKKIAIGDVMTSVTLETK
ncbi:MAG: peptidylprolyl isomerase [Patescibacteria group bacterium]|nr:peptidylprolyl isomerase [Patescibacteria group bacterium]